MRIYLETIQPRLKAGTLYAFFAVKIVPEAKVLSVFRHGDWGMIAFEWDGVVRQSSKPREFYAVTEGTEYSAPEGKRLEFCGQFEKSGGTILFVFEVKPY